MRAYLLLIIFFIPRVSYTQITINNLLEAGLGSDFETSSELIYSIMTPHKGKLMIGDFGGAKYIEYNDVEINFYGKAKVVFQFVYNKLNNINVKFEFEAPDTSLFRRAFISINTDFSKDPSKRKLPEYKIDIPYVLKYIREHCKEGVPKENAGYTPIPIKSFGVFAWVKRNTIRNKDEDLVYSLHAALGERHNSVVSSRDEYQYKRNYKVSYPNQYQIEQSYDGGYAYLELEMFYLKDQDIMNKLPDWNISYTSEKNSDEEYVKLSFKNGVYHIPVKINNSVNLDFVLDLGAADVLISPDVFMTLYRSGSITDKDFVGVNTYKFADGSTAKSNVFYLRSLMLGNVEIKDVRAAVATSLDAPLLLGQSALKKLPNYLIDNKRALLIIKK